MTKSKIVIALAACLLFTLPAFGDIYRIDFASSLTGVVDGTITGGPPYIGTAITISDMAYFKNGVQIGPTYSVSGDCAGAGCLSFDTGASTISLVGDVLGLGKHALLTGTIASFGRISFSGQTTIQMVGPDTKSALLLAALGVPSTADFSYANTEIYIDSGGKVTSAAVGNRAVPDGGLTAILLGGALMGIEALRRKVRV